MAEFSFAGVDRSGNKVHGNLNAPTEGEIRVLLRQQGIRPTRISTANARVQTVSFGRRVFAPKGKSVPSGALLIFTRQLNVLISSGIPLIEAVETLGEQNVNPNMKAILRDVREKVSQGSFFWEALSAYPQAFSKLYVSMIRAGEASGSLDSMLERLTSYIEDAERLKKLLKSAMIYPIAVVSIGVGVIALMLVFVIPKFEEMLKQSGQELPAFTKAVIDASHFLTGNFIPIVVGLGIGGFLAMRYLQTPEGRTFKDRVVFRMPIFGEIARKGAIARLTRTLQTLLASGVALLDAIDICRATVGNAVVESSVAKIREQVESGNRLGAVMARDPIFPKMVVQMIGVGESSGSLDIMLQKIADFYEAEVEAVVGGLSKLIEPFILVFLGGTVGGLLIAMYLPIFKMAGGAGE